MPVLAILNVCIAIEAIQFNCLFSPPSIFATMELVIKFGDPSLIVCEVGKTNGEYGDASSVICPTGAEGSGTIAAAAVAVAACPSPLLHQCHYLLLWQLLYKPPCSFYCSLPFFYELQQTKILFIFLFF
ncbi:hypothetical protein CHARACLAT_033150 [Characodon lateralis]|uniref:Uncharacterized protein n=1 Tax=Characodon lateralis TaxID=208331 RepID=A0ABU7E8S2_9TELE|nr:hypothetical protein [Characodon lateralis]